MVGGRCRSEGEICAAASDCCNGQCVSGRCAVLSECDPAGEACDTSGECCSRACADDGTGFTSCQFLGGCRPFGELCRADSDCCNDAATTTPGVCERIDTGDCSPACASGEICNSGVCVAEADAIGRCANPPSCAPAGEICGVGGSSMGTNECCPGNPDGREFCVPSAAGVHRCLFGFPMCLPDGRMCTSDDECCTGVCMDGTCGASSTMDGGTTPMCLADGAVCATPDQCCSGICTDADGDGVLTCNEMCVADGGSCTTSADCCSGNCRTDGTCGPADVMCLPLGADCTADGDCCSGYCDPGTMTCATIII